MKSMPIRVSVAGATGWTGSAVTNAILDSQGFQLVGAIARKLAGTDIGTALGREPVGLKIVNSVEETAATDVLIDYTGPESVKNHVLTALDRDTHVIIGTSGLTASDYVEIARHAQARQRGVVAAGNFSITATLAKHFTLIAARHLPSWEILDYASADKVDVPSGTTREIAEELTHIAQNRHGVPLEQTLGPKEARGATIGDTQVHSVRLSSYVIAFETIFGLPGERLTIRHDAGSSAQPYVEGTLLAVQKVVNTVGLIRGLDQLLFPTQ